MSELVDFLELSGVRRWDNLELNKRSKLTYHEVSHESGKLNTNLRLLSIDWTVDIRVDKSILVNLSRVCGKNTSLGKNK